MDKPLCPDCGHFTSWHDATGRCRFAIGPGCCCALELPTSSAASSPQPSAPPAQRRLF